MNAAPQGGQSGDGVTPPVGGSPGGTTPAHAGAISNLRISGVTSSGFKATWNPVSNATQGYSWGVTQMNGVKVKSGTTKATSVSVSGLHTKYEYNFGIQALPGGPGNNEHVTLK
jgi:hypothetical protein